MSIITIYFVFNLLDYFWHARYGCIYIYTVRMSPKSTHIHVSNIFRRCIVPKPLLEHFFRFYFSDSVFSCFFSRFTTDRFVGVPMAAAALLRLGSFGLWMFSSAMDIEDCVGCEVGHLNVLQVKAMKASKEETAEVEASWGYCRGIHHVNEWCATYSEQLCHERRSKDCEWIRTKAPPKAPPMPEAASTTRSWGRCTVKNLAPFCAGSDQMSCEMTEGCQWGGNMCMFGTMPFCSGDSQFNCEMTSGCEWTIWWPLVTSLPTWFIIHAFLTWEPLGLGAAAALTKMSAGEKSGKQQAWVVQEIRPSKPKAPLKRNSFQLL